MSSADTALNDMPTIHDSFGCDPWDAENFGKHPASRNDARGDFELREVPAWRSDL
jgi:hypothetical protein